MHIITKDGWRALTPKAFSPAIHTPTMLEAIGITQSYNGAKAMAAYANDSGHGYYFQYNADGTSHPIER